MIDNVVNLFPEKEVIKCELTVGEIVQLLHGSETLLQTLSNFMPTMPAEGRARLITLAEGCIKLEETLKAHGFILPNKEKGPKE